ncbi:DUF6776 family protein [Dokdonella soli]|uniref:Membrane protein n=1 Tax=Dokdonella soli TaxID=529810 RepID=A0ABP3TW99_9GAMM
MPSPIPSLVIRPHDPAQRRRAWLLLALAWLGSLLIVAAIVATVASRGPRSETITRLAEADRESEALKARIAVLERSEQVAKAALADVQQTLREREEEIDGLRVDLAFYGRLVGGGKREGLAVHALRVKPVKDSKAWNFTATLTQNFKRGQDIRGRVMLSVEGVAGGKLKTLDWSALTQGQDASGIEYSFKYFQQVSGTIMLPADFAANRVIVRADGDAGRVEQEFSWKDAVKGEESDDVRQ